MFDPDLPSFSTCQVHLTALSESLWIMDTHTGAHKLQCTCAARSVLALIVLIMSTGSLLGSWREFAPVPQLACCRVSLTLLSCRWLCLSWMVAWSPSSLLAGMATLARATPFPTVSTASAIAPSNGPCEFPMSACQRASMMRRLHTSMRPDCKLICSI